MKSWRDFIAETQIICMGNFRKAYVNPSSNESLASLEAWMKPERTVLTVDANIPPSTEGYKAIELRYY